MRAENGASRCLDSPEQAAQNTVKAIGKGLLKTISKMGISTIQSYRGAPDLRGGGPGAKLDRPSLHGHGVAHRRRGPGCAGDRGFGASRPRRLGRGRSQTRRPAAGRRRLRLAARRRAPHVEPGDDRAGAARGSLSQRQRAPRRCRATPLPTKRCAIRPAFQKYREYAAAVNEDAARKATLRGLLRIGPGRAGRAGRRRGGRGDPTRGGGARQGDRAPLLHRRDEPRLDLPRGPRDTWRSR